MFILGISFGIDSAACLVKNGKVIAGAIEERFNRVKHSRDFPNKSIDFCLQYSGLQLDDIDHITFFWNPGIHLHHFNVRNSLSWRSHAEFLHILPNYLLPKLQNLAHTDFEYTSQSFHFKNRKPLSIHYVSHHLCHAASAFFPSPFSQSAILTVDGYGEKTCTWMGVGKEQKIETLDEIAFPNSLGSFYAAITQYLGFRSNCDEGKVMGLAPYGQPKYSQQFTKMFALDRNEYYNLDLSYFSFYQEGADRLTQRFIDEFGPSRSAKEPLQDRHRDMARSAQKILEDILISLVNKLVAKTGSQNICIAGGVGLNSVANGRILQQSNCQNMYIQPVAHDGGGSIGSALYLYHQILQNPQRHQLTNDYLGPEYSRETIEQTLKGCGLQAQYYENIEEITAQKLIQKKIVGWFQGRMEMGPRSLGNRSILADPRQPDMKDILNSQVKFRESFRPYAPSVLYEKRSDFFEMEDEEPFMLKTYKVKTEKQSLVPAITHIDGTARVQTVKQEENPRYWRLIYEFEKLTEIPLLLNTSFNIMGEPIIASIEDAIKCYITTGLDVLILGNYLLQKHE